MFQNLIKILDMNAFEIDQAAGKSKTQEPESPVKKKEAGS